MASFSAATLLATFQTSHASSSKGPHVALAPVHGSNGELAVAAVQGDGVWTYDLRTLRPISSHTVPPSTTFTCPPLCCLPPASLAPVKGKGKNKAAPVQLENGEDAEMSSSIDSGDDDEATPKRRTMVGVEGAAKSKKGTNSAELWIWTGEDSEKRVIELDQMLHSLHDLPSSRYSALGVSTNGQLVLIEAAGQVQALPNALEGMTVLVSKLVSRSEDACGVVLVGRNGRIYTIRVDTPQEGACSANITSESRIGGGPGRKGRGLLHADVSEDGTVSAVDDQHVLHTTDVRRTGATSARSAQLPRSDTAAPVISVPSQQSLILHSVAAPTPSLLLCLTESDSPVVVAASDLGTVTANGEVTQIYMLGHGTTSSAWTAAFVVWHKHGDADSGRSVVYTCEITIPVRGFGMNTLLGSQERTMLYFGRSGKLSNGHDVDLKTADARLVDISALPETQLDAAQWSSIRQIIRRDTILSSATLVAVLKRAVSEDQLSQIYADLLSLPPPPIDFRLELRRNATVEEATHLLRQLVEWSQVWCDRRTEGLAWPDASAEPASQPDLPTLESILTHTSLVLDSHLPLLVEHEAATPLLESLSTSIGPLLTLQAEIRQLQAPIDALLTLARREEKRRAEFRAKKEVFRRVEAVSPKGKGAGGKKGKHQGNPGKAGGASLPGEGFGKWRVEDFAF